MPRGRPPEKGEFKMKRSWIQFCVVAALSWHLASANTDRPRPGDGACGPGKIAAGCGFQPMALPDAWNRVAGNHTPNGNPDPTRLVPGGLRPRNSGAPVLQAPGCIKGGCAIW